MELGLWSLANTLLLLLAMMSLALQHASAARHNFRNETDRLALHEFKLRVSDDPLGVLESWNDTQHHCRWQGVTCDARHQRVIALTLRGKSLFGFISPHIGNLSFLKSIELGENRFRGEIPLQVGRLFRLRSLNLSSNILGGQIPVNLSRCLELSLINIRSNRLEGKIPVELASLKSLEYLMLRVNNLTGEIPSWFGNLSSLKMISLSANNFEGSLPQEIGLLKMLYYFGVGDNRLAGTFPTFFYNNSELIVFSLVENFFHGNLPDDIGLKMSNIQYITLDGNQFDGNIPISFINATKLYMLDLASNKFEGNVPTSLGNLPKLWKLNLENNLLGHNSSSDLDFLESLTNCSNLGILSFAINNLGGELPNSIGNLSSQLKVLVIGENKISGTIPIELVRLTNLYFLSLEANLFSGTAPSDIGKFEKLQRLSLERNMLFGPIPSTLFNITSLYFLQLGTNNFEGTLPENLGNCENLKIVDLSRNKLTGVVSPKIFCMSFSPQVLDLSQNSLSGPLPPEVGKMTVVNMFNISDNKFSEEIPTTLGDCSNLEYLDMEGNFFTGTIPQKLASLKAIRHLDLSRNNLTGQIPRDIERLTFLKYLNLSFNNFEGEVPTSGVFGNASLNMLAGNSKLCGGIPQLRLSSCLVHRKKKSGKLLVIIVPSLVFAVVLTFIITFVSLSQRRDRGNQIPTMLLRDGKILRVSYRELDRATSSFSQENVIGSGGYGIVYKGSLGQYRERFVAIKVLDFQKIGAPRSFQAECNALRNIRHRNLVALLTYCSSIDFKGREFKALVYEFMENGSIDMWLHSERTQATRLRNLNLLQRLNIAIDVASALDYLHNHCGFVIVHCDLKPSNILLDNDFVARVGDFGLARLLNTTNSSSAQDTSSTVAIKGSIGYAAPEYGMGGMASTQGDVYSYGILLLEMITGRRPTDDAFVGGLDLHNYVKMNLSSEDRVIKIIDPFLLSRDREENTGVEPNDSDGIELDEINANSRILLAGNTNVQRCIIPMFEIALKCSARSPNDRMNMNESLRQLRHIRDDFLAAEIN